MQQTIDQLEQIVQEYAPRLQEITEEEFIARRAPGKWTKKELVGHLVDSAQNNIRRFVVGQYEQHPFIKYDQDKWVAAANYQQYNTADLLAFWILINKHICVLLRNMPSGAEQRECMTDQLHSIAWLAQDYIRHLLHHLHQVLMMEPIAYP
ncbi:MAG: DinB family protein [Ferruginibacter sp.]